MIRMKISPLLIPVLALVVSNQHAIAGDHLALRHIYDGPKVLHTGPRAWVSGKIKTPNVRILTPQEYHHLTGATYLGESRFGPEVSKDVRTKHLRYATRRAVNELERIYALSVEERHDLAHEVFTDLMKRIDESNATGNMTKIEAVYETLTVPERYALYGPEIESYGSETENPLVRVGDMYLVQTQHAGLSVRVETAKVLGSYLGPYSGIHGRRDTRAAAYNRHQDAYHKKYGKKAKFAHSEEAAQFQYDWGSPFTPIGDDMSLESIWRSRTELDVSGFSHQNLTAKVNDYPGSHNTFPLPVMKRNGMWEWVYIVGIPIKKHGDASIDYSYINPPYKSIEEVGTISPVLLPR